MCRVGWNHIRSPYMTICMVMSLLKTPYLHRMYTVCTPYLHRMYTICTPYVHRMYTVCTPYVHRMYTVCTPYVHRMYTVCTPHVHRIYTVCTHISKVVANPTHVCTGTAAGGPSGGQAFVLPRLQNLSSMRRQTYTNEGVWNPKGLN